MRTYTAALVMPLALGIACSTPLGDDAEALPTRAAAASYTGNGTFAQVTDFGANPGGYRMWLYTPKGLDGKTGAPAVLFFHGCTQQAADVRNLGWEKMADTMGFYVAYPEQPSSNNPLNCFNWAGVYGDTANLVRGKGENQSAASMVNYLLTKHGVDPARVHVAGFSAGAAMVAVMLATWPDLFAAGGISSGVAYHCGTSVLEALNCQSSGRDLTPDQWGKYVRDAYPGFGGPYPRLTIWHGTRDTTVVPKNQNMLRDQWTNVHGIGQTPDEQDTIGGHARARYHKGGSLVVETVALNNMSHGVAVDPGHDCGQTGSYAFDEGVCAAQLQTEFFFGAAAPPPPPGKPPVVGIDSPAAGATVSGNVAVSGHASDADDAVVSIDLRVDNNLRASLAHPPARFEIAWNAALESSGAHQLTLTATDASGLQSSATINLTVSGMGPSESASGTCTEHYLARRLGISRYLACGRCHGYINKATLYRFGTRWTDDASGMGCMDR